AAASEARPDRPETEAPAPSEVDATIAPQPAEAERVPEDVERVQAVVAAIKSLVPDRPATSGDAAGAVTTRETGSSEPQPSDADREAADDPADNGTSAGEPRLTLAQKMRAWLGRAA
ncbi:MAG: NUDIX hydrolase, partial [Bradyrhizobium sp.]